MSELNKGTKFVLSIPIDEASYNDIELGRAQEERIEQDTDKEPLPELSEGYEDIPTVLLVEDNEELLKLMTELLSSHYKILTAIHGVDALKKVMDNSVDILISDVMMPEMDGLELCRTLKSDLVTSHIPVILLTAKSSTRDRVDCYNAGADGYISKPFDLKVLEARINNFISTKKRKQQQFKADVEINISTLEYPSLDEEFLKEAVQLLEQNLTEYDFDINSFAEGLKMSKSSLYRKIKTMTGLSPIEFIRNIKLKHACRMLKQTSMTISEVAYASGFSDPKYFATCFRAEFGMTPRNYQKKITDKEE
jgi:DNA-binding response OmpR family regulator